MIKKTMFAACLAALAFAALPALASATYPDPYLYDNGNPIENTKFTVHGEEIAKLEDDGGSFVECATTSGEGEFENEETGKISLKFHGCHTIFNIPCTTPGDPSGTITVNNLPFHLKTVDHGGKQTPGVLITPGEGKSAHGGTLFASFKCSFAGQVEVGGNGILGTITSPEEGKPSNTATIKFQSEKTGVQTHRTATNDKKETVEYDLKSSFNGASTTTAAQDAEATLTFADEMKPEIKTTTE